MKKATLAALLGLCFALAACGRYSEENAIFIAHNHGNDRMVAIVDGKEISQLAPNSVSNQEIIVLVARRPVRDYGYGPSQVDKTVQVSVVFKNLRTGGLSRETMCQAGAKIKTLMVFEPQSGSEGYAYCTPLYTSG